MKYNRHILSMLAMLLLRPRTGGGHRVNAIRLVDQAIDKTKKGIEAGE